MPASIRSAPALLLAAAALAAGAAPAAASEVTVTPPADDATRSSASFLAGAGEANDLTIARDGDDIVFSDPGSEIEADPEHCTVAPDRHAATCSAPGAPFGRIVARLGDLADTATCALTGSIAGVPPAVALHGGDGDDRLTGCDALLGPDALAGDGGDDVLRGRRGDDVLAGGPGQDVLAGGDGDDQVGGGPGDDRLLNDDGPDGDDAYDGGPGLDAILYDFPAADADVEPDRPGATVRLALGPGTTGNGLPGESDAIAAVEDATGSRGADELVGSDAGNLLDGGAGDDRVEGGAGHDWLSGGPGADLVVADDGQVDRVSCGGQPADRARVDDLDERGDDCPAAGLVVVAGEPPPPVTPAEPPDTRAPVILLATTSRRVKARHLRRTGRYRFRITPDEPATGEFALTGRLRGGRIATAGYLTLAESTRRLVPGRRVKVALRIPRSARRTLRKGRRIRLEMTLRDAAGNETFRRVSIKLT